MRCFVLIVVLNRKNMNKKGSVGNCNMGSTELNEKGTHEKRYSSGFCFTPPPHV